MRNLKPTVFYALRAALICSAAFSSLSWAAAPGPASSGSMPPDPAAGVSAGQVNYLDQGWSDELRHKFYFTPQGSQFFPYAWFLALETADETTLFDAPTNMRKFGWIYADSNGGGLNPGELPIGFAIEATEMAGAGKWLGLNCAACHTANIKAGNAVIRLDGAPAMADFSLFLRELSRAVTANHPAVDPPKFLRFAGRVLGANASQAEVAKLRELYTTFAVRFSGRAWMRTPPVHPGPGRVDALTQITNALAVFDLGVPDNLFPPAAPTSYPFLWLTPRLDWVQWNPVASNPIARNAGQVLGVFGDVDLGADPSTRYSSTIEFRNLFAMEEWIASLKPPRWPEHLLGMIDEAQWKQGKKLFDKSCRACHNMPPFDLTEKKDNIGGVQFIKIKRVPHDVIGTDPLYVQSILGRFVYTDRLASTDFSGEKAVPAFRFFSTTVGRATEKGFNDLQLTPAERLAYSGYRFYPKKNAADPSERPVPYAPPSFSDLKGGPLLGIWATAPFLHNGSVPNLYELLSAPELRSRLFWAGSNEFDAEKVGFVASERSGLFRFDTSIPGNRNGGHVYPARPFGHDEKMAVIEYLKDPERY